MNSYRTHQETLDRILHMLERGRLISRKQAALLFGCTDDTISVWLNQLRELGHEIHYSRSLQKYVLTRKKD